MPDVTHFAPSTRATGYSAHDCALEDTLFGLDLDDETPEGPTRTWVYQEGAADDVGCFEPLAAVMAIERRHEAIALIRIEPQQGPKPRWERPSARDASKDFWVAKHF
jgi:hypothetical protein